MRLLILLFGCLSLWACQEKAAQPTAKPHTDFTDLLFHEKQALDSSLRVLSGPLSPQQMLVYQRLPNQAPSDSLDSLPELRLLKTEQVALRLRVRNYSQSYRHVQELIAEYDAVLIEERERRDSGLVSNTLQLWLEPEKLDRFVTAVQDEALTVKERQRWRRDLSAQQLDLDSRFYSKQAAKARLQELLQKAESAQAILPIQRELDVLNEELEALQANMRYLSQRATYHKLILQIFEEEQVDEAAQASFNRRFNDSLDEGWANFKESSIWLAHYWPWVLIGLVFGIPLLIWWRYRVNRRQRLQQQQLQLLQQQQQPLKPSSGASED